MIGVLVMAYGGPNNLDEVEPYLLDVRGYRPTAPEIIHEVRERYKLIGGRSPILEQTQAQADALQAALDGNTFKTFVGMRHWHPYIKETLAQMQAQGIDRAIGLVMAPHYSRMSIGAYYKKIEEAQSPIEMAPHRTLALAAGLSRCAGRSGARLHCKNFPPKCAPPCRSFSARTVCPNVS